MAVAHGHNRRVDDFGIPGYRARWLTGRTAVATAHGPRLAGLTGRTLTRVWLAWDLTDDSWFADCPVLLDFAGEQVEVNHWKFDEIAISWNSVDPTRGVRWLGSDDVPIAWRSEPLPELTGLVGRPVTGVELLEWHGDPGDLANGTVALGVDLGDTVLVVFNALDENGLSVGPLPPGYRRHRLTGR